MLTLTCKKDNQREPSEIPHSQHLSRIPWASSSQHPRLCGPEGGRGEWYETGISVDEWDG